MSLTSKIQALLTYANGITSKEDTTLGDAVKSLADGYGGGYNILEGDVYIDSDTNNVIVNHNLGVLPLICYLYQTSEYSLSSSSIHCTTVCRIDYYEGYTCICVSNYDSGSTDNPSGSTCSGSEKVGSYSAELSTTHVKFYSCNSVRKYRAGSTFHYKIYY